MEAGPSKPNKVTRLRAYKACENCRLRKIKCSGDTPCRSCTSSDIAEKCFVRVKAKPNRPSAKVLDQDGDSSSPHPDTTAPSYPLVRNDHLASTSNSPSSAFVVRPVQTPTGSTPTFRYSYDSPHHYAQPAQYSPAGPQYSPAGAQGISPSEPRESFSRPNPPAETQAAILQADEGRRSGPILRRNPLTILEDALGVWCTSHSIELRPLLFQDEMRIAKIDPPPPLPTGQFLVEFEDGLMRSLIAAEDIDTLEVLDCPRLLNLYSRYRALPHTLTDDQIGLVYASLCIARFTQLRGGVAAGMKEPRTLAREDVTYYRMARASLSKWGRASITSMWALFCLITYVQINGGAGEHGEVLSLMAWQVRALGLHRRETAQLYPAHELGVPLILAYSYAETFRSIMTDFTPAIPIAEMELGVAHQLGGVNRSLGRVHIHAVNYLRDYANAEIDITTAGYLAVAEEAWSADLDYLRVQPETGIEKVRRGWAEMRIHWLRLLLHIPRMTLSPGRANQATIYAARSAINIINTHSEAAFMGKLDPSWPQLKRIMTCGQVLILCCARGEIQQMEGVDLFAKLIALLEAHEEFWPSVKEAIRGYREAAAQLGISISPGPPAQPGATADIPFFPPLQMNDDAAGWFLGLDLGILAQDLNGNTLW